MADSTTGLGVPGERHRAWSLGGALSHTWTPSPRLHLLPVCTWDPRFLALEERLGFGFRHLPYLSRLCPVTCPPCWAFSSNQRSLPHAVPLLSWAQPGLSLRPPPPAPRFLDSRLLRLATLLAPAPGGRIAVRKFLPSLLIQIPLAWASPHSEGGLHPGAPELTEVGACSTISLGQNHVS